MQWRQEKIELPWYFALGMTLVFVAHLMAPTAIGQLVEDTNKGFVVVLGITLIGAMLSWKVWQTGTRSKQIAMFLFLLPILALIATRLRVGEAPLSYGIDMCAIILFVMIMWPRKWNENARSWIFPVLGVYVGLCLLSAITTEFSITQAIDHWAIMVVIPALFFYMVAKKIITEDGLWWLMTGIVAAGAVTAVAGLVFLTASASWGGLDASSAIGLSDYMIGSERVALRLGGPLGSGAVLARLHIISLPICVAMILRRHQSLAFRMTFLSAAALMFYVILMGQSRSSLIGIAIGVATVLLLSRERQKWYFIAATAIATLVFTTVIGEYLDRRPIFSNEGGSLQIQSSDRFEVVYPITWKMFLENPIFGVGLGEENYMNASLGYGKSIRHAHNMFLQFFSDRGVPAAVAFMIIWFGSLWGAWRRIKGAKSRNERLLWGTVVGALVGITAYLQGEPSYALNRGVWQEVVVWTLLALPYTQYTRHEMRPAPVALPISQ